MSLLLIGSMRFYCSEQTGLNFKALNIGLMFNTLSIGHKGDQNL